MARLNFPDPAVTQTYTEAGITWTWNATLGVWSTEGPDITGGGSDVHVGPNPPATSADGDLWWNTDDGRLYIYYEDGNTNQWVDASPDNGGLTQTEADGLYLSKTSDDTAACAITFEGLTTHEAGVSVTGGDAVSVVDGFYGESNRVFVATNSVKYATFGTPTANNRVVQFGEDVQLATSGVNSLYNLHAILNSTGHGAQDIYNVQSTITADTGSTAKVFLFDARAAAQTGAGVNLVGFHSDISANRAANGTAHSIYCRGDAPSFFQGSIQAANYRHITKDGSGGCTFSVERSDGNHNGMEVYGDLSHNRINLKVTGGFVYINGNPVTTFRSVNPSAVETEITNATTVVKAFQPKVLDGVSTGFSFANLQANIAEATTTYATIDDDGNETGQTNAYDPARLVPILTKALQEALTEIDTLKSRLEAIEANEVVDDATDNALLTLVANLATRVTNLEGA